MSNAPIGKFRKKEPTGKWITNFDHGSRLLYAREDFSPNTYLKDAEGEWIYEGDRVYSTFVKSWYVVGKIPSGAFVLLKPDYPYDGVHCGELWSAVEHLTHTPPKKRYKRVGGSPEVEYYVDNQRVGVADRRKTFGRALVPLGTWYDETITGPCSNGPEGRRKGPQDRRTGEGA